MTATTKILYLWLILISTIMMSHQECLIVENPAIDRCVWKCENTDPENFVYDFYDVDPNIMDKDFQCDLQIVDSTFVSIHAFSLPFPKTHITELTIQNSSVEFIDAYAFERLIHVSSLTLSNNKLSDLHFVKTLPLKLEELRLNENNFEIVTNVFYNLINLRYLDLSGCNINKVEPDSFFKIKGFIFLNFSHNGLTSFDVVFNEAIDLSIDLSFNNINYLNFNDAKVNALNLNVNHNNIISIAEILPSNSTFQSVGLLDLSFNDLSSKASFTTPYLINDLNLANTNIDDFNNFNLSVSGNLDISGNNFAVLTSYMFNNVNLHALNLYNSSVTAIEVNAFNGFGQDPLFTQSYYKVVLNMSSNPILVLKDYIFNNTFVGTLDISNCLIQKMESNAFFGIELMGALNLGNNQISYIEKSTFQNLSTVKIIDLSFNVIKKMDNHLFLHCENLEVLKLSNSKIEIIRSESFLGTTSLRVLDLRNNLINQIEFVTSSLMDSLYLQKNKITHLSLSCLQNASTNVLTLTGNKVRSLKNSTANRTFVKEMDLSRTNIYNMESGAFRGFSRLEILNLSNNFINKILPGTFVPLKNLINLDLKGNHIISFSPLSFPFGNQLYRLDITVFISNILNNTFSKLNVLRTLNIFNSTILSLNENSFKGLVNLKNFNWYHALIDKIMPGAFNGLYNLIDFNFQVLFKNVTTLKTGNFLGLPKMEVLNLSSISISSMDPETFIGLTKLKRLFLNHNKLRTIVSDTFLGLKFLKTLNLSNNDISTLEPNSFFGLNNLLELSLCNNNVTKLSLGTLQNFPYLRVLSLCRNNISKLLTGTFSNLKHLIKLDLSYNNITKLKMDNLFSLSNLRHLDLTGNHLIEMNHLEMLKSLQNLELITLNNNRWKCNYLASVLMDFQSHNISWVSDKDLTFNHENIDGIKCIDICKFFYCVDDYI